MGDINSRNRQLIIRRHEHAKLVAMAQMEAREIRLLELEEETERSKQDIEAQKKIIDEAQKNIDSQKVEIEKEKADAKKAATVTTEQK